MKNVIYQHRFKGKNGWRYELRFIPADTAPLSSPTVKDFPRNAFLASDFEAMTEYDTLPISFYNTPELKLKLNFSALPLELKQWLVQYAVEVENLPPITTLPSGTVITGILGQLVALFYLLIINVLQRLGPKVPLTNFWVVSTDYGDETKNYDEFTRVFEGVQKRVPTTKFKAVRKRNGVRLTVEITVVHVVRSIAEAVKMTDLIGVAGLLPDSLSAVGTPQLCDAFVQDGNGTTWQRLFVNGHTFMLIPVEKFLLYIRDELQKWYRKISRDNTATFGFDLAIPHQFYAQTNTVANTPTVVVPFPQIRIIAQIRKTPVGEQIGGLLSADKEHGWGNGEMFTNVWDWLNDFAENFYVKLALIPTPEAARVNTLNLRFGALFQNIATVHSVVTLTDFIDYDFDIEHGGNTIRAAKSDEIRMPSEADRTSTIYAQTGSESESDFALHFFLHNLPTASTAAGDESGSYLQADGFNVNALYHSNPLSPDGYTRLHEAVRIGDGLTDYAVTASDYATLPNALEGTANDNFLWSGYATKTQEISGLPNAACKAMQKRFGKRHQSVITGRLKLRADMNNLYVGDVFTLDTSIEESFAPFGTKALLLKCQANWDTGIADVEFLTIPD